MPSESHRPRVIKELAGQEIGLGKSIALGRVVAIVLVGGDEVISESSIRFKFDGQSIVVTKENGLADPCEEQLGRETAVESPNRLAILHRKFWMERYGNSLSSSPDIKVE